MILIVGSPKKVLLLFCGKPPHVADDYSWTAKWLLDNSTDLFFRLFHAILTSALASGEVNLSRYHVSGMVQESIGPGGLG